MITPLLPPDTLWDTEDFGAPVPPKVPPPPRVPATCYTRPGWDGRFYVLDSALEPIDVSSDEARAKVLAAGWAARLYGPKRDAGGRS